MSVNPTALYDNATRTIAAWFAEQSWPGLPSFALARERVSAPAAPWLRLSLDPLNAIALGHGPEPDVDARLCGLLCTVDLFFPDPAQSVVAALWEIDQCAGAIDAALSCRVWLYQDFSTSPATTLTTTPIRVNAPPQTRALSAEGGRLRRQILFQAEWIGLFSNSFSA